MKIEIGKDYKLIQREHTEKEISNLINQGIELITLESMQQKLKEIGLKLDLNENSYLNLYYNDSNLQHYYSATTSPLDENGISVYNIESEFYNKNLKGDINFHTEIGRKLDDLRDNYFCIYTKRKINYILSF